MSDTYCPQVTSKIAKVSVTGVPNGFTYKQFIGYSHVKVMVDDSVKEWYNNNTFKPSTEKSIGFDLRASLEGQPHVTLEPGERIDIDTGVHIQPLENGIAGFVFSRSGLGAKHGIVVAQGVGVIDPDYNGSIHVWLLNTSDTAYNICQGDRIAQLVFMRYELPSLHFVDALEDTNRNDGGFGSTGTN